MDKIVALIVVNVVLIGMGLLVYSGKVDNILTISFGKSPLEKSRIDYKSFRRTVLAGMIVLDVLACVVIFMNL